MPKMATYRLDPDEFGHPPFFSPSMGHGLETHCRIEYCRECGWFAEPDDFVDDARELTRANGLVSSRGQGHAYFNRGHSIGAVYVPFEFHPDPFQEGGDVGGQ